MEIDHVLHNDKWCQLTHIHARWGSLWPGIADRPGQSVIGTGSVHFCSPWDPIPLGIHGRRRGCYTMLQRWLRKLVHVNGHWVLVAFFVVFALPKRGARYVPQNSPLTLGEVRHSIDHLLTTPNATILSSNQPILVSVPQLLTGSEAAELIERAQGGLRRSRVVSDHLDRDALKRTSAGGWLKNDPFVDMIDERLHRLVGIPRAYGESLHVLKYSPDQEYRAHMDSCRERNQSESCTRFLRRGGGPSCGPLAGGLTCGDRMLTVIVYLLVPEKGGATAFPYIGDPHDGSSLDGSTLFGRDDNGTTTPWYCRSGSGNLQIKPRQRGDAIIFWSYTPDDVGRGLHMDPFATHAGCAVVEGEKYILTKWIRSSPVRALNSRN